MVDTTVIGSDSVTSGKPKFSLKHDFELVVQPRIIEITRKKYPVYIPVIQVKNDGPQQDEYSKNC